MRDSKPERVSGEKKTVRWTVFSREIRSGYAARRDDAKRHHPSSPARRKPHQTVWFFFLAMGIFVCRGGDPPPSFGRSPLYTRGPFSPLRHGGAVPPLPGGRGKRGEARGNFLYHKMQPKYTALWGGVSAFFVLLCKTVTDILHKIKLIFLDIMVEKLRVLGGFSIMLLCKLTKRLQRVTILILKIIAGFCPFPDRPPTKYAAQSRSRRPRNHGENREGNLGSKEEL